MKIVTVYRVDHEQNTKKPIGILLERRKSDRIYNKTGLLQLARRQYATSTDDALRIEVCYE